MKKIEKPGKKIKQTLCMLLSTLMVANSGFSMSQPVIFDKTNPRYSKLVERLVQRNDETDFDFDAESIGKIARRSSLALVRACNDQIFGENLSMLIRRSAFPPPRIVTSEGFSQFEDSTGNVFRFKRNVGNTLFYRLYSSKSPKVISTFEELCTTHDFDFIYVLRDEENPLNLNLPKAVRDKINIMTKKEYVYFYDCEKFCGERVILAGVLPFIISFSDVKYEEFKSLVTGFIEKYNAEGKRGNLDVIIPLNYQFYSSGEQITEITNNFLKYKSFLGRIKRDHNLGYSFYVGEEKIGSSTDLETKIRLTILPQNPSDYTERKIEQILSEELKMGIGENNRRDEQRIIEIFTNPHFLLKKISILKHLIEKNITQGFTDKESREINETIKHISENLIYSMFNIPMIAATEMTMYERSKTDFPLNDIQPIIERGKILDIVHSDVQYIGLFPGIFEAMKKITNRLKPYVNLICQQTMANDRENIMLLSKNVILIPDYLQEEAYNYQNIVGDKIVQIGGFYNRCHLMSYIANLMRFTVAFQNKILDSVEIHLPRSGIFRLLQKPEEKIREQQGFEDELRITFVNDKDKFIKYQFVLSELHNLYGLSSRFYDDGILINRWGDTEPQIRVYAYKNDPEGVGPNLDKMLREFNREDGQKKVYGIPSLNRNLGVIGLLTQRNIDLKARGITDQDKIIENLRTYASELKEQLKELSGYKYMSFSS